MLCTPSAKFSSPHASWPVRTGNILLHVGRKSVSNGENFRIGKTRTKVSNCSSNRQRRTMETPPLRVCSQRYICRRLHRRQVHEASYLHCCHQRSRPQTTAAQDPRCANHERWPGQICHREATGCSFDLKCWLDQYAPSTSAPSLVMPLAARYLRLLSDTMRYMGQHLETVVMATVRAFCTTPMTARFTTLGPWKCATTLCPA